jgi:hypothetical protein
MNKNKFGLAKPSFNTIAINFVVLCVIIGWIINMTLGAGLFLIYFLYFFLGLTLAGAKSDFYTRLFTTNSHEYIFGYKILIWPKYLANKSTDE